MLRDDRRRDVIQMADPRHDDVRARHEPAGEKIARPADRKGCEGRSSTDHRAERGDLQIDRRFPLLPQPRFEPLDQLQSATERDDPQPFGGSSQREPVRQAAFDESRSPKGPILRGVGAAGRNETGTGASDISSIDERKVPVHDREVARPSERRRQSIEKPALFLGQSARKRIAQPTDERQTDRCSSEVRRRVIPQFARRTGS